MAEVLISPGVLARENDQSQITSQPVQAGAAIIGPTVKGQEEIPKLVTSYSEYEAAFGSTFLSGSNQYTYFTSISAYNYFQNGGTSLLVTRVTTGSFTEATSSRIASSNPVNSGSLHININPFHVEGAAVGDGAYFDLNGTQILITSSTATIPTNTATRVYVPDGGSAGSTTTNVVNHFNFSKSLSNYKSDWQYMSASLTNTATASFTTRKNDQTTSQVNPITTNAYYVISGSVTHYMNDGNIIGISTTGSVATQAFSLETIGQGELMNSSNNNYYNSGSGGTTPVPGTANVGSNNSLVSGSQDNVRWEIASPNTSSGVFSVIIRGGNDTQQSKNVLETFTNVSLDPLATNYISKVIGDLKQVKRGSGTNLYLQTSGSYKNASRYVRVKEVNLKTPNYLDNAGNAKDIYTGSIPPTQSGSFIEGTGVLFTGSNSSYYQLINNADTQGILASDYTDAINLLANKDDYKYNLITTPGLAIANPTHATPLNTLISNTENRGDNIVVMDLVNYNASITQVTAQAASVDSSYVASYWPWLRVIDPNSRQLVWVPASTLIPGVYAYNDKAGEPWFAPSGINRGGLGVVDQAERKLTNTNRDTLYTGKVNPIATFPRQGIVVFGQKTLQTKASALDRVNVRRLLIALKNYISQIADTLVFEQNTAATRNTFLSQVIPYMESVQQRQGLYAFKVVMDDSNNTPDVIDRNELIGAVYLQPSKTAEFIYLDFNILPTGATFPV